MLLVWCMVRIFYSLVVAVERILPNAIAIIQGNLMLNKTNIFDSRKIIDENSVISSFLFNGGN